MHTIHLSARKVGAIGAYHPVSITADLGDVLGDVFDFSYGALQAAYAEGYEVERIVSVEPAVGTPWVHYIYAPAKRHAEQWAKLHWAKNLTPHTAEMALAYMGGKAHPGNLWRVRLVPCHMPGEAINALAAAEQVNT